MDVYAEANGQYIRSTIVPNFEKEVVLNSVSRSFSNGEVSTDAYFSEPDAPTEDGDLPPGSGLVVRNGAYVHLDLTKNVNVDMDMEPGGRYRLTIEGPLE